MRVNPTVAVSPRICATKNFPGLPQVAAVHECLRCQCLGHRLEAFLVDDFHKGMYNRRAQLAGGTMVNAFVRWSSLFLDCEGGSDAAQFGGVRRLQEFPKCTSMHRLTEHLEDWVDVLATDS